MGDGISIDIGGALPFIIEKILGVLGKDTESRNWAQRLDRMLRLSAEQSSHVQIIGMYRPVPLLDIYRPTLLVDPSGKSQSVTALEMAKTVGDAIVRGGPGTGKTTFLRWLYLNLTMSERIAPLLFTLRWPGAITDLSDFIDELGRGRKTRFISKSRLVLLIDGYDEISTKERAQVSSLLREYRSLGVGHFVLTCRSYYDVFDVAAPNYEIGRFTVEDARLFVKSFAVVYQCQLNAEHLIKELEEHALSEFLAHPLLLALVCILQTGPNTDIPRKAIGLIRRAIDTLTSRWDGSRNIARMSSLPLDGEERLRCLMHIAYEMREGLIETTEIIESFLAEHLALVQVKGINKHQLLEELAQWYGLLVPVSQNHWQFVHRTIHDYLAARVWVENGTFGARLADNWNIRSAYASCLLQDATLPMTRMLAEAPDIIAFSECLYNGALFDARSVASAVLKRIALSKRNSIERTRDATRVVVPEDLLRFASQDLLVACLMLCSSSPKTSAVECLQFLTLAVLSERRVTTLSTLLSPDLQAKLSLGQAHHIVVIAGSQKYSFQLRDAISSPRKTS